MFAAGIHRLDWPRRRDTTATSAWTFLRAILTRAHEAVCALRGHHMVLHFEPDRLCLECLACGAQTPGWTIDVKPEYRSRARAIGRAVRQHVTTPASAGDPKAA